MQHATLLISDLVLHRRRLSARGPDDRGTRLTSGRCTCPQIASWSSVVSHVTHERAPSEADGEKRDEWMWSDHAVACVYGRQTPPSQSYQHPAPSTQQSSIPPTNRATSLSQREASAYRRKKAPRLEPILFLSKSIKIDVLR